MFDFEMILGKNYYTNLKSLCLCFAVRFRTSSNATRDLGPNLLLLNSYFAHWIKEIDVTKYGTNKSLIQTTTPKELYRFSDAMLKDLPKTC